MIPPAVCVAVVAVATWDSWRWLAHRLSATPEEALSLALTVGLLCLLALPRLRAARRLSDVPLMPVTALLAAHAAAIHWAPAIFAAALAATALLYALYRCATGLSPPPAFWGLVALAMPVVPSLQFVLGYPMRLISAQLTVALLSVQGVPISREGTFVVIGGETIQFDAPCSGVSMLWALILVTLMFGLIQRLDVIRLGAALVVTIAAAIVCNVLRVSSLLFAETVLGAEQPAWLHEGLGLVAFALTAVALLGLLRWPASTGLSGVAP